VEATAIPGRSRICKGSLCLIFTCLHGIPVSAATFDQALSAGHANIDMRLRYESVKDHSNKDASAATLRSRLGYQTADYKDFSAFAEFEDVRTVAGYGDFAPEKSGYATVADPEVTQLNRAFISYKGFVDTQLTLGRQRIILDNARHVGNVGWRQNEQTFDAYTLVNTSIAEATIHYSFVDKVNGILPSFNADVSDHLINIGYTGFKPGKVSAYAYLLKDNTSDAKNNTYGLRFSGATTFRQNCKLLYTAEVASQDTKSNDALYRFLEIGAAATGVTAKFGYEVLGSDNGNYGFQTPLATKHAFNGWTDQFLSTPADGLQDMTLSAGGVLSGTKLLAVYHDYSADSGSADYGSELNLLASRAFFKLYTVGLKYANYQADDADALRKDVDKFWIWGELKINQ